MAIFAKLYCVKIRVFLISLLLVPLFMGGQDTTLLPRNYSPYYRWDTLPDSLYLEYQALYPERWSADSLYYVLNNKEFADSVFNDSVLKSRLFYARYNDSVLPQNSLTNMPPPYAGAKRVRPVPVWLYGVILFILVCIVFLKYANLGFFNLLFLSFIKTRHCDTAIRENDTPVNFYNLMATLLCSLIFAVFAWFWVLKPGWVVLHPNASVSFLMIFIAIAVFYLLRYLFIMLAGAVLGAEYTYSVLVQTTVSGNMWLAVVVLPVITLLVTILLPFTGVETLNHLRLFLPLYLAGGAFAFLLIKQARVIFQVFSSFPHSIIYLILYLCALEIVPYLAIFKLIVKQTG